MNNKHRALLAIAALIVVFLGLLFWYRIAHRAPGSGVPSQTATTTPETPARTLHLTDSSPYYDIDTAYPSSTPLRASAGAKADLAAVRAMRGFEQNTIEAFKENNGLTNMTAEEFAQMTFGRDAKYAMTIEYKVYESPKTVSYVYSIYQDTLGAHPNTYYRTFTFDRATGNEVGLEDLFASGAPYLERLSARTRADLPAIMARMAEITPAEVDHDYINSGTLPEADAFQNFAIDGDTLLVIFPPYQVGPYVYGTIIDPVPFSTLSDILNPRYRL